MKNVIKILLFLAYSISIFLVKHDVFTAIVVGVNLLLTFALKLSIKEEIGNILSVIVFILLTTIINILAADIKTGIRIGINLSVQYNIHILKDYKLHRNCRSTRKNFFNLQIYKNKS